MVRLKPKKHKNPHRGSDFSDWLIKEQAETIADLEAEIRDLKLQLLTAIWQGWDSSVPPPVTKDHTLCQKPSAT